MTIPSTAFAWEYVMDPADIVDFQVDATGLLEAGEAVGNYTLTVLPEAAALGLTLGTGPRAPTVLTPGVYRIWLSIDVGQQANSLFDGAGTSLPLELTVTSDSVPSRTRQRTLVVKVAQQ